MKVLAITPLLVATVVALPELAVNKRDKHTNGATANLARKAVLNKRAGVLGTNVFDVLSWSSGGAYYANVTVGTPAQEQTVILDTGSSDLYFDASTAGACETSGPNSCQGGTFNPSKSSTYKVVDQSPAFNTSFGDGSTAFGPYSTDVFGIDDLAISNVQFGVATTVNSTTGYAIGLMGVGYTAIEAVENPADAYPNVPQVLVDAGVINSRLYSVFLNDENDVSGSILFGGVDTTKYTGDLVTLNLLPEIQSNLVFQFITTVTSAKATVSGKTTTLFSGGSDSTAAYGRTDAALAVLLDTGSTAWSIPQSYWDSYFAPVFTYVDSQGVCSCSYASSGDSVTLEFGGKVQINVPAREFIVPIIDPTTNAPAQTNSGEDACLFLIQPGPSTGQGFLTLGDAVLRSMYVVFDLDNGQVSIAQADINNSASPNIVTVSAGPSGVAKAVSGVSTAPPNSNSIYGSATATASYAVSTVSPAIGTATGEAAVPASARVSGGGVVASGTPSSGSGSGGTGGSSSTSTPKGAASGLLVPSINFSGMYVTAFAIFFAALGAGLMM